MKDKLILFMLLIALFGGSNIATAKSDPRILNVLIPLDSRVPNASKQFGNLDYGLRIQVRNNVNEGNIINLTELPSKEAKIFPKVDLNSPLGIVTEQNLDQMASALGFKMNENFETDYILNVTIKECNVRARSYDIKHKEYRYSAATMISWELLNSDHQVIISSTTSTGHATANTQIGFVGAFLNAYYDALDGIDWSKIAPKLKISKSPAQEKNKQVSGEGDSALEGTVIRWYIISNPQGADITWRVISSTPDVKNTNGNYVGSTPYESTETFDIKGLTYNNSGNVQIEVTCEKNGYITQKRRFNLRQAIDQKEISTKFNLVKDEEND